MAQQVLVDIVVNGKQIAPFSNLKLTQRFNGHHEFELRFNHDVLEQQHAVTINKSSDYLGKSISITFNTLQHGQADHVFKGIITDINLSNNTTSPGDLIFKGYSPTILLETGPNNMSYLKKTLNQIVRDCIGNIPSNDLSIKVAPVKKTALPYVVQYRESNFEFIRRLAAEYGEWCFYDGSSFQFGKPSQSVSFALQYPNDISEMNLSMRITPLTFEQIGYISKDDKKIAVSSTSISIGGLDNHGRQANKASDQIFSAKPSLLTQRKFEDAKELDESVKMAKSAAAANLVVLTATSDCPYLRPGVTVSVSSSEGGRSSDVGKYVITNVTHATDETGNYENTFEAVPSTLEVMANPYANKPMAEPQLGIVTDNQDPDKLGKVKVQLLWQKSNESTPYIRVMSPNAGMGNASKKNRGMHFTPEVGDYVIVGFNQNDPDRPIVMGSVPHGKAVDSGPNTKNHIKSITTRSGSTIYFHDKDDSKEQEIRILTDDKNYVSILMKNGEGDIKIFSSKAIEVNSSDSVTVQGTKTVLIKSEKITVEATDSILMKANKEIKLQAVDVILEGSKSFEAKGGASAKVSGAQLEVSGSATAKVSGAMMDLEASGVASLKGALVKIN